MEDRMPVLKVCLEQVTGSSQLVDSKYRRLANVQ